MIQKMAENGLLAELDFDNIPNISYIAPEYMEKSRGFDPENKYSVPYLSLIHISPRTPPAGD